MKLPVGGGVLVTILMVSSLMGTPASDARQRAAADAGSVPIRVVAEGQEPSVEEVPEALEQALSEAADFAYADPDKYCEPYVDAGQIVLGSPSAGVRADLEEGVTAGNPTGAGLSNLLALADAANDGRVSVRDCGLTIVRRDDVLSTLADGLLPYGIVTGGVDPRTESAVLEVAELNPSLEGAIQLLNLPVSEYVIVVVPGLVVAPAGGGNRSADVSPYSGGAKIIGEGFCSSAFGVKSGTWTALVTAGHCIHRGGLVTTGAHVAIGNVASGRQENFNYIGGSQEIPGQSMPGGRGDVALIAISPSSGKQAGSTFYWGDGIYFNQKASFSGARSVAPGNHVQTHSYNAPYRTSATVEGVKYYSGDVNNDGKFDYVVKNVHMTREMGTCVQKGNSGGLVRFAGEYVAAGMISGSSGWSEAQKRFLPPCRLYFTAKQTFDQVFPGRVFLKG